MKEIGNVKTTGAPILKKAIIACGQTVLNVGGGIKTLSVPNVKAATDVVIASLVSDDSGTPITQLFAEIPADGQIKITRTDDVSSADDGVANYIVLRQA